MNKVVERRQKKLEQAVAQKDWKEVSKLLDQPFENLERQGRQYGLIHLNYKIDLDTSETDLYEIIPSGTLNPEELYLLKEDSQSQVPKTTLEMVKSLVSEKDYIYFKAYHDLDFCPKNENGDKENENWTKLVSVLKAQGIKTSGKTVKAHIRDTQALLESHFK